jgi:tripartite-type tricarboxylate transporter receptor subunit TctC
VGSVAAAQPFIATGKLIPLAVTGRTRWPTLPNVPTLAEGGYPDATFVYWTGIRAPAGTPLTVRENLNKEFRAILAEAPVRERLLEQGYETVGGSVADFDKFLHEEERISRKLMQELKLKVE